MTRRDFTLLELLIFVGLLGLLSSMIAVAAREEQRAALGRAAAAARRAKILSDFEELDSGIGATLLRDARDIRDPSNPRGWPGREREIFEFLLERLPTDPWGRPYVYEGVGCVGHRLWTLGADGAPGGYGEDADLFSPGR